MSANGAAGGTGTTCDACGASFALRFAYQRFPQGGRTLHACSTGCRQRLSAGGTGGAPRYGLAVLNQKGGTGKTTTSVNLAAGLARDGHRVLLVDCDSQGHVGVSLGVRGERSLYHVLVEGRPLEECVVNVAPGLDVLPSNETLAGAEVFLARQEGARDRLLRKRLAGATSYRFVLLDCAPSLSLLTMNALTVADGLLVPVSCDFLSLVGVRQIVKTVRQVNELLAHPLEIVGVLPTLYDQRNRISDESIAQLRAHFGDRVLEPIRINTRLREAPSHGLSIFDYAPESRGAEDYARLVGWLAKRAGAGTGVGGSDGDTRAK
jgi:chromosome partitioning protein